MPTNPKKSEHRKEAMQYFASIHLKVDELSDCLMDVFDKYSILSIDNTINSITDMHWTTIISRSKKKRRSMGVNTYGIVIRNMDYPRFGTITNNVYGDILDLRNRIKCITDSDVVDVLQSGNVLGKVDIYVTLKQQLPSCLDEL